MGGEVKSTAWRSPSARRRVRLGLSTDGVEILLGFRTGSMEDTTLALLGGSIDGGLDPTTRSSLGGGRDDRTALAG